MKCEQLPNNSTNNNNHYQDNMVWKIKEYTYLKLITHLIWYSDVISLQSFLEFISIQQSIPWTVHLSEVLTKTHHRFNSPLLKLFLDQTFKLIRYNKSIKDVKFRLFTLDSKDHSQYLVIFLHTCLTQLLCSITKMQTQFRTPLEFGLWQTYEVPDIVQLHENGHTAVPVKGQ